MGKQAQLLGSDGRPLKDAKDPKDIGKNDLEVMFEFDDERFQIPHQVIQGANFISQNLYQLAHVLGKRKFTIRYEDKTSALTVNPQGQGQIQLKIGFKFLKEKKETEKIDDKVIPEDESKVIPPILRDMDEEKGDLPE